MPAVLSSPKPLRARREAGSLRLEGRRVRRCCATRGRADMRGSIGRRTGFRLEGPRSTKDVAGWGRLLMAVSRMPSREGRRTAAAPAVSGSGRSLDAGDRPAEAGQLADGATAISVRRLRRRCRRDQTRCRRRWADQAIATASPGWRSWRRAPTRWRTWGRPVRRATFGSARPARRAREPGCGGRAARRARRAAAAAASAPPAPRRCPSDRCGRSDGGRPPRARALRAWSRGRPGARAGRPPRRSAAPTQPSPARASSESPEHHRTRRGQVEGPTEQRPRGPDVRARQRPTQWSRASAARAVVSSTPTRMRWNIGLRIAIPAADAQGGRLRRRAVPQVLRRVATTSLAALAQRSTLRCTGRNKARAAPVDTE
jgi:hypothetical protein